MNITIGIGNMKRNLIICLTRYLAPAWYRTYFQKIIIIISFSIIIIAGCKKKEKEVEMTLIPKANVTVTSIINESINDTIFLNASSVYNKKTSVQSPIAGYLTKVNVSTGAMVSKGNDIFEMETKEYRALNQSNQRIDTFSFRHQLGKITINSPASGQIMALTAQDGAYVQEGTGLCTIVSTSDLNFELFVPVEYTSYFNRGQYCTIVLPTGQRISAHIVNLLSRAESNTQSETFLLKPNENLFIPEGINVKVFSVINKTANTQLLPKDAVLANETLDKFWVMKCLNDTTAVKIPVKKGITTAEHIEILEPRFSESDRLVLTGNYGLPDTAYINIQPWTEEK